MTHRLTSQADQCKHVKSLNFLCDRPQIVGPEFFGDPMGFGQIQSEELYSTMEGSEWNQLAMRSDAKKQVFLDCSFYSRRSQPAMARLAALGSGGNMEK